MKIVLCGSISACSEIDSVAEKLRNFGHEVEIPLGCTNLKLRERTEVAAEEKAQDKIEGDLLRRYFQKIKDRDILIAVNPEKRGIQGYIGGNTLIELSFGHVLGKPLYCLYAPGEVPYLSEILAMQPTILDGDLSRFLPSQE